MFTRPIQLTDVIYNAANQCFEATVTVYDTSETKRYACAIDAPISMSFQDAAEGLRTKALRLHANKAGMHASVARNRSAHTTPVRGFDLGAWLHNLVSTPDQNAA